MHVHPTLPSVESLANGLAVGENSGMPTITFECPDCGPFEKQFSIMKAPPKWMGCEECLARSERVWEAPEFICDRADRDPDHIPKQYRVSDRVKPESAAEGKRIEKAYQAKMERTRRDVAEASGGTPLAKTHEIPAHLYHGKIKQTGDKNYWLDPKNRNKHKSTRVDTGGRNRRGKG